MAPQVTRIAIAFAAGVFLFWGFRSLAVPEGFGEEGFYRMQGPGSVAAAAPQHAGMSACMDCHPDKSEDSTHVKSGVHCESCHGPAGKHVEDWEASKPFVPSTRADCARCHSKVVARPSWYPQIDPKVHNPDSRCVDCHVVHQAEDPAGAAGEEAAK
jgi:hypothetical protein